MILYFILIISLVNSLLIYSLLRFMIKDKPVKADPVFTYCESEGEDVEVEENKRYKNFDERIKYLIAQLGTSAGKINAPEKANSEPLDEHVDFPSEDGLYDLPINNTQFTNVYDSNDVEIITEIYEKQLDDYVLRKQRM